MSLPALFNWNDTKSALHQTMQVIRSTRLLGADPMPNDLHYSAIPTASGGTTGSLDFGGALRLDYASTTFVYEKDGAEVFSVPLNGKSQTSVFDAVFAEFKKAGMAQEPNRSKVTQTAPFNINKEHATTYAEVQWRMYTALGQLKGRMYGTQSVIALWPHGFDLSMLWFAAGTNERNDPHINFGFSPGTPDVGQPYFYFYTYPLPDGLRDKIPSEMTWIDSWSAPGGVLKYEQFANESNPEAIVLDVFTEAYRIASSMLKASVT